MGDGDDRESMEKSLNEGDPATWATPVQVVEVDDPKLGLVRVQMWYNLHFRQSPKHPMTVFRVERLKHLHRQPLWARLGGSTDELTVHGCLALLSTTFSCGALV